MFSMLVNTMSGNIKILATETTNEQKESQNENNENENIDKVFESEEIADEESTLESAEPVIEWETMTTDEEKNVKVFTTENTDNIADTTEETAIKAIFPDVNLAAAMVKVLGKASVEDTVVDADLEKVTTLGLNNLKITDITGVEHLTNLKTLRLRDNQIDNIDALSGLVKLTELILFRNQITDLEPLRNLIHLTKLALNENQIMDISPLSNLTSLEVLMLSENKISNIDALTKMVHMNHLVLSSNQISNIDALSDMVNLEVLLLSANQISNIDVLAGLVNLDKFDMSNNQVSDIESLNNLVNLTLLSMEYNQITQLDSLANMEKLGYLNVSNNKISNIPSLEKLVNLHGLYLGYNRINTIEDMSVLTNLTDLRLNNNRLTNIDALKNLQNLTVLDVGSNQISNIDALSGLVTLLEIFMHGNQISDLPDLSNLAALRAIDLSYNKITNIAPLKVLQPRKVFVSLESQKTEESVDKRNNVVVENQVKDIEGMLISAIDISDNGSYDVPNVVWGIISPKTKDLTYGWSKEVTFGGTPATFSGVHTVKIPPAVPRKVTYIADDSIWGQQTAYAGQTISGLGTPEKFGYAFTGWLDEAGNLWDFETSLMPDADLTLTAQFVDNFTNGAWQVTAKNFSLYESDVNNIEEDELSFILINNGNVQVVDTERKLIYDTRSARFSVTNISDLKDLTAGNTYDVIFHFEGAIGTQAEQDNTSVKVQLTVLPDPVEPEEPTDPEQPVDPTEPEAPTDPEVPGEPEQPIDNETPTPDVPGNSRKPGTNIANTNNTATLAKTGGYTFEQLLFGGLTAVVSGLVLFIAKRQRKATERNK